MKYSLIIIYFFWLISSPFSSWAIESPKDSREVRTGFSQYLSGTEPSNHNSKDSYCFSPSFLVERRPKEIMVSGGVPYEIEALRVGGEFDGKIRFENDVKMRLDEQTAIAPIVDVYADSGKAEFPAGIELYGSDYLLRGERATADINVKALEVKNPELLFLETGLRVEADFMTQKADGLSLSKAILSSCSESSEGWILSASSIKLRKEKQNAVARNLLLRIKGVPLGYLPYLPLPLKEGKDRGFRFPSVGLSSNDGFEIGIPYEVSGSDNRQFSVMPRLVTKRGVGFETTGSFGNHLHQTMLSTDYLYKDRLFNGEFSREEFDRLQLPSNESEFNGVDRWSGSVLHKGRFGYFETELDHNFVSDQDYFRDVSSSYSGIQREPMSQFARVGLRFDELKVDVLARDFEVTDSISSSRYRITPEISAAYSLRSPNRPSISFSFRSTNFSHSTWHGVEDLQPEGRRNHVEMILSQPLATKFGLARVEGGYRYSRYVLDETRGLKEVSGTQVKQSRGLGFFSFDLRSYFDKDINWRDNPLIQTIEPRFYFLFQEYVDQTRIPVFDVANFQSGYSRLFRRDHFAGIDRIADANKVVLGISSSTSSKEGGQELLVFRIGRSFLFEDRRVRLEDRYSVDQDEALVGDLSVLINDRLSSTIGFVWDDNDKGIRQSSFHLNYRGKRNELVNVGYRKLVEHDINQTDVSLTWPLFERTSLFAKWQYDWSRNRSSDSFIGFHHENCCLEVKVGYRKSLDIPYSRLYFSPETDESILLQFNLKGLAEFGSRVESIMKQGIQGYSYEN